MKKKILICMCLLCFLMVSGCGKKEEVKEPEQTPTAALEDQEIEGLKISNLNLALEEGATNVLAMVENTTEESIYVLRIDSVLKDADGNVLGNLFFYLDKEIEPHTSEVIQTGVSSDVTNATSVEYTIVK